MKKYLPLVIIGAVLISGLQAVAMPFNLAYSANETWTQTPYTSLNKGDVLDVSQPNMSTMEFIGKYPLNGVCYKAAQSFRPTLNKLTRVEVMLQKWSLNATGDLSVSIQDDLNGSEITSISLPASNVSTEVNWTEFDFPDIMVTPGNTYYIILSSANVTDNVYRFWKGYGYNNGALYWTQDLGSTWAPWAPNGLYDMTFQTYGIDTTATNLNLTITGGIGVTVNTKNDGDFNATNLTTQVTITGGILGRINLSKNNDITSLAIGGTSPFKVQPIGLGQISIVVKAYADNAAQVTKTVKGFVLLFFVILK